MYLNAPSQVLDTLYSHILIYMNAMLPKLISYGDGGEGVKFHCGSDAAVSVWWCSQSDN